MMTPEGRRNWLKLKTRRLIDACGGLDAASAACAELCRPYSVKQLSRCQNPLAPDMLPLDIQWSLEEFCGQPIISRALVEARPDAATVGNLRDEASDVTELAARLQAGCREAMADDDVNPAEAAALYALVERGKAELDQVASVLEPLLKRGVR
ncbi:MAG: hypothetical protein EON91_02595 [Brevundimonas sp.]|uniref:hypothetical protein n=1 Tax=Brevundimonas sp. TaxID=1871086 RepID=UPI001221FD4B|nr:hypothetical protein [Brevundimonas sp.]RZJ19102.1 MAG: hypothetical protein EON91_02595 [Brevundimonas sp.]